MFDSYLWYVVSDSNDYYIAKLPELGTYVDKEG